ncbi:hypothetical protein M422DRAFT_243809 [Sphaerobolus stellatus SS14]|nr:hypothetical protein M422DRAFT_243809 [Sphaerobolus stellatus SS14]
MPLHRYAQKEDLKDIAAYFHFMDEDMKGTNRQLTAKIKDHMKANPVLRANPRFSALYGVRASKAATSVAEAGEEEQSARELAESEEELEEETDSEYEEV